jgi:hypothetical protein
MNKKLTRKSNKINIKVPIEYLLISGRTVLEPISSESGSVVERRQRK